MHRLLNSVVDVSVSVEYRAGWRVSVWATLGRFVEAREVDLIVVVSITLAGGEIGETQPRERQT